MAISALEQYYFFSIDTCGKIYIRNVIFLFYYPCKIVVLMKVLTG